MATSKKPVKSKSPAKKASVKKIAKPVKTKSNSVALKKPVSKKKPDLKKQVPVKKTVVAKKPVVVKKTTKQVTKSEKSNIKTPSKLKPVVNKKTAIHKTINKLNQQHLLKKKTEKGKKIMSENIKEVEKSKEKKKEPIEIGLELDKVKIPDMFKGDDADDAMQYTVEKKLIALYSLQQIDSQIDKIKIVRGELPLEVQDMEDSFVGLETRIENYQQEIANLEKEILSKQNAIKDSNTLIKKYKDQKNNVRNNREFNSLTNEIEFQTLDIQLSEKKIAEFKLLLDAKKEAIKIANSELKELKNDLTIKKNELNEITSETEKEETDLNKKSIQNQKYIEERLLSAYKRIRSNANNGLAVVKVERDACGGCFNKIPPQRQLDIQIHKKIIVCEYCGRILVDDEIANAVKIK